jgi:hypothetical protein
MRRGGGKETEGSDKEEEIESRDKRLKTDRVRQEDKQRRKVGEALEAERQRRDKRGDGCHGHR